MSLRLHKFTHANLRCPIYLAENQVFSVYYSENHKCTHVVSVGGTLAPVSESIEQVRQVLTHNQEGEKQNGEGTDVR